MSIQVLRPFLNLVVWVLVVEVEEFWFYEKGWRESLENVEQESDVDLNWVWFIFWSI